jgi:hypothetical protein
MAVVNQRRKPTWLGTKLNNMQLRCNLSSIERFCGKRNESGRVLISWNLLNTTHRRKDCYEKAINATQTKIEDYIQRHPYLKLRK